jgi:hypothetical protein
MEQDTNRTEHHVVTVWHLDSHPRYELHFRFAQGFIHAAIAILEEQQSSEQQDYFHIMPAHFALEHGIELFLKGAILLRDSSITLEDLSSKRFGHNLGELYKSYRQIYTAEQFKIYHRIDELVDWRATINDPRGFAARYPFDNKGAMYGSRNRMIDVEFELEIFREFLSELERLEREIKATVGAKSHPIEQFRYRSER